MINRTREHKDHETEHQRPNATSAGAGGQTLLTMQREARDLLDAGDDAIKRAISGDSEKFLRASRQQGGQ